MNLVELRNRCRSRFRDVAQAVYDNSEWNAYINEAQADVLNASPWFPFGQASTTLTLAAGAEGFTIGVQIPDAARITLMYNDTDDVLMRPHEGILTPWAANPNPDENRGSPTSYLIYGRRVMVWPRPSGDTQLTVGYVSGIMVEMTVDSDVPAIPDRYHGMLVDGALSRAYTDDGNADQAGQHQARFDRQLANLTHEMLTTLGDSYPALADNFWG